MALTSTLLFPWPWRFHSSILLCPTNKSYIPSHTEALQLHTPPCSMAMPWNVQETHYPEQAGSESHCAVAISEHTLCLLCYSASQQDLLTNTAQHLEAFSPEKAGSGHLCYTGAKKHTLAHVFCPMGSQQYHSEQDSQLPCTSGLHSQLLFKHQEAFSPLCTEAQCSLPCPPESAFSPVTEHDIRFQVCFSLKKLVGTPWEKTGKSWGAPHGCLCTRTFFGLDECRALGSEGLKGTSGTEVFCQWGYQAKACLWTQL